MVEHFCSLRSVRVVTACGHFQLLELSTAERATRVVTRL